MAGAPAGYEIGAARAHELAVLPRIEAEAATIFSHLDLPPEPGASGLPLSSFEAASSAGRLWVARVIEPPAPVGFALATLVDGSAHLHEMDVLPAHGRKGIGRHLVLHVEEWARSQGFGSLTLTTFRHLSWNGPFYSSLGFSEIADRDLGPELRAAMEAEAREGLDRRKRVAMRLELRAA
jgi:GNAT superfamily N-acetyltransferase